jgi:hypothetical protein
MPSTGATPSPEDGGANPATGKRRRGTSKKQGQASQQQQQEAAAKAHTLLNFAQEVALLLKRELTTGEMNAIATAVQAGKIKLMTDGEEWQKQVKAQAESLDPLGLLNALPPLAPPTEKGKAQQAVEALKRQFPGASIKEVMALMKTDSDFLAHLEQYAKVPDAELGRIGQDTFIRQMDAHVATAKAEQEMARKIFRDNLAYFWEVKMRLISRKYRPDLVTEKGRTMQDKLDNFHASDWSEYCEKFLGYGLAQADNLLREWRKEVKLLGSDILTGGTDAGTDDTTTTTDDTSKTKGGGKAGKELDRKAVQTAYKADLTDKLLGMFCNPPKGASAEEIVKKVQAVAQYEFEGLSPEEQEKCKAPRIKVPTNTVENIGIRIAKELWKRSNQESLAPQTLLDLAGLSYRLLQAAGEEIEAPKGMTAEQLAERIDYIQRQLTADGKPIKKGAASAATASPADAAIADINKRIANSAAPKAQPPAA